MAQVGRAEINPTPHQNFTVCLVEEDGQITGWALEAKVVEGNPVAISGILFFFSVAQLRDHIAKRARAYGDIYEEWEDILNTLPLPQEASEETALFEDEVTVKCLALVLNKYCSDIKKSVQLRNLHQTRWNLLHRQVWLKPVVDPQAVEAEIILLFVVMSTERVFAIRSRAQAEKLRGSELENPAIHWPINKRPDWSLLPENSSPDSPSPEASGLAALLIARALFGHELMHPGALSLQ